jgi:hypothetical protein
MSFYAINVLDALIWLTNFHKQFCMYSTNRHFVKHIACNTNTPEIEETICGILL